MCVQLRTHSGQQTAHPNQPTANFGALSNELYPDNEDPAVEWCVTLPDNVVPSSSHDHHFPILRDGAVVEYRQDPIPKSEYHTRLDAGELEDNTADQEPPATGSTRVRFWSDYSRVFLHPRTTQKLPDLPDWEAADGDWNKSSETFRQHDSVRP